MACCQTKPVAALAVGDLLIGFDGLPFFTVARIETQRDGLVRAYNHSGHSYAQYPANERVKVAA